MQFGELVWNPGPPPHVGWWMASTQQNSGLWRWWNGQHWSTACYRASTTAKTAGQQARKRCRRNVEAYIRWTDYYPPNARVPRVDPRQPTLAAQLRELDKAGYIL